MNELLVTGIEQDIKDREARIATHTLAIEQLKVQLEEARKPSFTPFQLVIRVDTREEAQGLRELRFWPNRIADHIEARREGTRDKIFAGVSVLGQLFPRISEAGDYLA